MPSSTRIPPRYQVSASGWPARRAPKWLLLAGAGLLVLAVAVALVHKPTPGQRAVDLRGFLTEVTADIQSCAGGVGESLTALHIVQAEHYRNGNDVSQGISVAQQGAQNCSPANNELIDNLEGYQVPESLASFHLAAVVTGLVSWAAPDAEQVQTDVASLLAAKTPPAKSQAAAVLSQSLKRLDAQRAAVDSAMNKAIKSLAVNASPPRLPG